MLPPSSDSRAGRAADIAACRRLLRGGSRTFFAASLLLPRRVREPASALYAFCRLADDAVDRDGCSRAGVAALRERLACAYAGRPRDVPADRALADVVARFAIPEELPAALLEGFQWDAEGRQYEDLAAVHAYAARVAGSVGAMMALIMGARDGASVARACELGVAMQLSNIARDVGEDARAGRLYLPRAWLREGGIDPDAWLAAPRFSPTLGSVIQRLLLAADGCYRRAEPGIAALPVACRPGIRAARLLYDEIGATVAGNQFDSVSVRAIVPARRKAVLLMQAFKPNPRHGSNEVTLEQTRWLVDAATRALPPPHLRSGVLPARGPVDRVAWLVDLFGRLERREHGQRTGAAG